MTTVRNVPRNERRLARKLAEKLTKSALKLANRRLVAGDSVKTSPLPHMRMDNVLGVRIYRDSYGQWTCDLLFHEVPPGAPDAVGTLPGTELHSRDDALAMAEFLLSDIVLNDIKTVQAGWTEFSLDRGRFAIAPDTVRDFSTVPDDGETTTAHFKAALLVLVDQDFPDGDLSGFYELPADRQKFYLQIMAILLSRGTNHLPRPHSETHMVQ